MHPFYMSRGRIHSSPNTASFMNMHPFDTPWSRRWIAIFTCIYQARNGITSCLRLCNMHNEGMQVCVFDTIAAMFDRALFRHILCNSNDRLTNYNDPRKVNIHTHGPCILLINNFSMPRFMMYYKARPSSSFATTWTRIFLAFDSKASIVKLMLSWRRARRVCLHIPLYLNISDILRAA